MAVWLTSTNAWVSSSAQEWRSEHQGHLLGAESTTLWSTEASFRMRNFQRSNLRSRDGNFPCRVASSLQASSSGAHPTGCMPQQSHKPQQSHMPTGCLATSSTYCVPCLRANGRKNDTIPCHTPAHTTQCCTACTTSTVQLPPLNRSSNGIPSYTTW